MMPRRCAGKTFKFRISDNEFQLINTGIKTEVLRTRQMAIKKCLTWNSVCMEF